MPMIRAAAYQRPKPLPSMVVLVIGGCAASSAPAAPSQMPGPAPGGTAPVPPKLMVCTTWNPMKPSTQSEVGGGEPEPDADGAADVGLRRGEPERSDVRGERGGDGEQRHHERPPRTARPLLPGTPTPKSMLHGSSSATTSSATASPSRTRLVRVGT